MLLEPDRFRHTPPIAPERSHGPARPKTSVEPDRNGDAPSRTGRDEKRPPEKA